MLIAMHSDLSNVTRYAVVLPSKATPIDPMIGGQALNTISAPETNVFL